jgi:hypothetical protein
MQEVSHVWSRIQGTLLPFLRSELDPVTEKQERLIAILEFVRVEDFIKSPWFGALGRPRSDRQALARAYVVKAFYNMTTTDELIERLKSSRNLRRICGWERVREVPNESTFSRAFLEFAESRLPELVHAELIKEYESHRLVCHISRDSTQIEAREKPIIKPKAPKKKLRRGRPRKGEVSLPKPPTMLERQQQMSLYEMCQALPTSCDRGVKKGSKGVRHCWTGYKLHIDTADGEIPISCILTSASVQDSQVALPLMKMTKDRVTNLYDLMDSAYDTRIIWAESELLGHVPIIENNPRRGEKVEMAPAQKQRYKTRNTSERANSRLKDTFGGRQVRVRGAKKVMAHLMFGILVLAADQLLRLAT